MRFYLACYDISDDKIRNKVGDLMLTYGDRVQDSVYEIALRRVEDLQKLQRKAKDLMEPGDDLRFYYLNQVARQESQDVDGKPVAQFPAAVII